MLLFGITIANTAGVFESFYITENDRYTLALTKKKTDEICAVMAKKNPQKMKKLEVRFDT